MIILCVCVADYACSAPCSAQSNFSHSRGSGSTWGAGAPTCPQPAAPPPVLATTDQKLTPGQRLEEYRPLESTVSKVHVTEFYYSQHRNTLHEHMELSLCPKSRLYTAFPFNFILAII